MKGFYVLYGALAVVLSLGFGGYLSVLYNAQPTHDIVLNVSGVSDDFARGVLYATAFPAVIKASAAETDGQSNWVFTITVRECQ